MMRREGSASTTPTGEVLRQRLRSEGPSVSPEILLSGVTQEYGNGGRALDGIALRIPSGQFVALIGRSGAGKTTLLRCLSRSLSPTSGRFCLGGEDLTGIAGARLRAHRARVGMIFQQFNLVRRLRVLDNVLIGRLPHARGWRAWAAALRTFSAADRQVALRCLAHVDLLEKVWQRADTLSGGEQQRVAIARTLAQEPRLILADEPVASLDLRNGHLVMQTLQRIAAEFGITVIATLHHVEYVREYADRVIGLRKGRLVFDGPPAELTPSALAAIFGEAEGEAIEGIPARAEVTWAAA